MQCSGESEFGIEKYTVELPDFFFLLIFVFAFAALRCISLQRMKMNGSLKKGRNELVAFQIASIPPIDKGRRKCSERLSRRNRKTISMVGLTRVCSAVHHVN